MEAVAEHINEMQKIFEEYGTVFDELCKVFRETYPHKQVCEGGGGSLTAGGLSKGRIVSERGGLIVSSSQSFV